MSSKTHRIVQLKNELSYYEHYLETDKKQKFNYLTQEVPYSNPKKEAYQALIIDRRKPHQWIEFKNPQGEYYVASYYSLGGYNLKLTKINYYVWSLNDHCFKLFRDFSWFAQLHKNQDYVVESKYLFSMSEVATVVADVTKINKLSIFK